MYEHIFSPSLFTDVINTVLPEPHASLLNGIVFGIPIKISETFYSELKRVGLLHLVVLSGSNITFLGAMVMSATRALSKKASATVSIIVIVVFVLFVGPQPPIVRAGISGIIGLLAVIFNRRKFALYTLCVTAVITYVLRPDWLTSVSFQLSFGASLGIILFAGQQDTSVAHGVSSQTWKNTLQQYLKEDIRTSLAAQAFTAPIIFVYFKQISLIAPVSNIFVSFVIPPLMILGFLLSGVSLFSTTLSKIIAIVTFGLLDYMIKIIHVLSLIPGIYFDFSL